MQDKVIATNVAALMQELGLSATQLAKESGVAVTTVLRAKETGTCRPSSLATIAHALSVSVDELASPGLSAKEARLRRLFDANPPPDTAKAPTLPLNIPGLDPDSLSTVSVSDTAMSPTVDDGDLVWFRPAGAGELRSGDLVVVTDDWDSTLVRRLERNGKDCFGTCDNREYLGDRRVKVKEILGVAVAKCSALR